MARLRGCRFHVLVSYRPWIAVPLRGLRKPQQSKYLGSLWDQTKKTSRSTVLKKVCHQPKTQHLGCNLRTLHSGDRHLTPPKKNTHPMARSFKTVLMQPTKESDIFCGWRGVFRWPFTYIINIWGWKMMTGTIIPEASNLDQSHEISWNLAGLARISPPFCPRTSWKKSCEDKHSRPRHTWRPKERGNQNEKHMTKTFDLVDLKSQKKKTLLQKVDS